MVKRLSPTEIKPIYNEAKATQAAALFLELSGGGMNYMKLIKLLYNSDREALSRWARPITLGNLYSMKHGQVISQPLDKLRSVSSFIKTHWDYYIDTNGYDALLINECDIDELSQAEMDLIKEIYEKYKDMDGFQMGEEHKNPELFPEYIDPGNTSIKTEYTTLLQLLGYNKKEISEIAEEFEELSILEEVKAR